MHDFLNSQELQIFKFCHVPKVRLVRGLPLFVPPGVMAEVPTVEAEVAVRLEAGHFQLCFS